MIIGLNGRIFSPERRMTIREIGIFSNLRLSKQKSSTQNSVKSGSRLHIFFPACRNIHRLFENPFPLLVDNCLPYRRGQSCSPSPCRSLPHPHHICSHPFHSSDSHPSTSQKCILSCH